MKSMYVMYIKKETNKKVARYIIYMYKIVFTLKIAIYSFLYVKQLYIHIYRLNYI